MDYDKLIEQLNAWNEQHLSVVCGGKHFACDYLCENEDCIVVRAATAIETLRVENKKLRRERDEARVDCAVAEKNHANCMTDLARVTAERDAAVEKYEAEKEDFLDYALSGTQNAAPFCRNRHLDCVDKRGWCIPVKCHGFSRDKED